MSPDAGGVERARAFSKRLGTSLAIIDKRRPKANVLLQLHDLADRLVLDLAEVGIVALASGEQVRRAQQAADVVGAERRRVTPGHQIG